MSYIRLPSKPGALDTRSLFTGLSGHWAPEGALEVPVLRTTDGSMKTETRTTRRVTAGEVPGPPRPCSLEPCGRPVAPLPSVSGDWADGTLVNSGYMTALTWGLNTSGQALQGAERSEGGGLVQEDQGLT